MKVEATFKVEIKGQEFTLTIDELRALKTEVDAVLGSVQERPQPYFPNYPPGKRGIAPHDDNVLPPIGDGWIPDTIRPRI